MTPKEYATLDDKPYESHYLFYETMLAAPVAKLWPHALRIGSWMQSHRLETIAGTPEQAGHFQRVHARNLAANIPAPHYHLYGIAHVEPLKLISLEVFPERGGSYGEKINKTSFDLIFFTDLGASTHVSFLMLDVKLDKDEGSAFLKSRRDKAATLRENMARNFGNLERLATAQPET